jgi:hypothetical protein
LEIQLPDFKAEHATLKWDYLRPVGEVGSGGVPTILDVHVKGWFLSLGRISLQNSVSTNVFDRIRHQVDLRQVAVSFEHLGKLYLSDNRIHPGDHFLPLLGWHLSFSICFLVNFSLVHELCFQGIDFGFHHVAPLPE